MDSWDSKEQRYRKDLMASIPSSDRSNCFITTAMSFNALSTRSPAFIAAQNKDIALFGSLDINCTILENNHIHTCKTGSRRSLQIEFKDWFQRLNYKKKNLETLN